MAQFILIISTVIKTSFDLDSIKNAIADFNCITEWSQDLEDSDKILRIVSAEDITEKLIRQLERAKVSASVLQVFEKGRAITNQ